MKVQVVGRNIDKIIPMVRDAGLEMTGTNPDIIIPYGGDGTLLGSEREFPGVPKFPLRDNNNSPLCADHHYPDLLDKLKRNEVKKFELMKLSGKAGDRELFAMNDVFIHNIKRVSAIRYQVWIDDELYAHEVVGDAAGVATGARQHRLLPQHHPQYFPGGNRTGVQQQHRSNQPSGAAGNQRDPFYHSPRPRHDGGRQLPGLRRAGRER